MGPSVALLCKAFPDLIDNGMSIESLDMKWRMLVQQEHVSNNLGVEGFWAKIFAMQNVLGENMYPQLKEFIGDILTQPHSSACAERIFSQVALVKNKTRNKLKVPTVNSIMLASGMIRDIASHQWNPSKQLIDKYHKYQPA